MTASVFVDTNVFLYSIDEEPASAAKRARAEQLLMTEQWGWSIQVAAEFFVNATSLRRPFRLAIDDASALVENWLRYPTLEISTDLLRAAIQLQKKYRLSYWDAAILAAAKQLACHTLFSEDLNNGQDYDGVLVVNPFL
jgi:predicted nucleic acid-binding protein